MALSLSAVGSVYPARHLLNHHCSLSMMQIYKKMDYQKKLNAWFSKFEHRFDSAVPRLVAETAAEFFQDRFKTQEWDKVPWPALDPKYAAKKTRGKGRILTATGKLRGSITPTVVNARRVVISAGSAQVPYARVHNEGLRIRGVANVRGYTNTNFMGRGKPVQIKPHSRRYDIQFKERRFMGHSKYLNRAIITELTAEFNSR